MPKAKAAGVAVPSKTAEELLRNYFETLRKLQADVQKQIEVATRALAALPQEVQGKARKEAVELVNAYIEAVRAALGQADAGQRLEQAVRNYVTGIQKAAEQAQRDVIDALQEFASTLRDVPNDFRAGVQSAFAEYSSGLKETFADVDFATLEPEEASAVGQSLLTVALYTRAAMGK